VRTSATVCGVASRPAMTFAGSCGATKNSTKVATLMIQSTRSPNTVRRTMKLITGRSPPLGDGSLGGRVHGIADRVTEQVERQRDEQQRDDRARG
jgi:hypothetical protein